MDAPEISELKKFPPPGFTQLREESEKEGFAMLRRLEEGIASGKNPFDRRGEKLLGVFVDGKLAAVGGLNVDPFASAGELRIGRLRHIYVNQSRRRSGLGRALVLALLGFARQEGVFQRIRLRTDDAPARRFYESLGFAFQGEGESTHELDLLPR